jgi:hypothetical protein
MSFCHLRGILYNRVMPKREPKHSLVDLWELVSGEKNDGPLVNIWELVGRCKTRAGYNWLWKHANTRYARLKRQLPQPVNGLTETMFLSEFAAAMYALGLVRGMQLGQELERERVRKRDRSIKNDMSSTLLKYAAVRRALLHQPARSAKEICEVLDDHDVTLPRSLRGKGTWGRLLGQKKLIEVTISKARKAAIQDAMLAEFMAVAKGVGEDNIIKQFLPKKFDFYLRNLAAK